MFVVVALRRPIRPSNQPKMARTSEKTQVETAVKSDWNSHLKKSLYRTVEMSALMSEVTKKSASIPHVQNREESEFVSVEKRFVVDYFVWRELGERLVESFVVEKLNELRS